MCVCVRTCVFTFGFYKAHSSASHMKNNSSLLFKDSPSQRDGWRHNLCSLQTVARLDNFLAG